MLLCKGHGSLTGTIVDAHHRMLELVPLSLDDLELDLKGREVPEEGIAYHLALAQRELASSRPEDEGLRSHVMGAYLVYG